MTEYRLSSADYADYTDSDRDGKNKKRSDRLLKTPPTDLFTLAVFNLCNRRNLRISDELHRTTRAFSLQFS